MIPGSIPTPVPPPFQVGGGPPEVRKMPRFTVDLLYARDTFGSRGEKGKGRMIILLFLQR